MTATEAPEQLKGAAAEILLAHPRSDSARTFAAALAEKGIALAMTTKEDADRSQTAAAAAKEKGSYAPVYREGEIVAVDDRAYVYRLNERTTGSKFADMQRYLRNGLDTSKLPGIGAATPSMYDAEPPPQPEPKPRDPKRQKQIDEFRQLLREALNL